MNFLSPRPDRFLELVLLGNILVHFAAVLSIGLLLMPGLPGGGAGPAGHPTPWFRRPRPSASCCCWPGSSG
jgi:hypothetical protein